MTNGLSLEELMKEGTYPEEYAEGENWRILHGATLKPVSYTHLDIGVFESETAAPVSFSVQWLNMTRIELMKKDVNTQNPVSYTHL